MSSLRRLLIAGSSGPTLWTPSNLSITPKLWLNDTSSVTDAGAGACSQWDDISGNAGHYVQNTATNRPLIQSSAINGLRAIRGDGNDNYMIGESTAARQLFVSQRFGYVFMLWQRTVSTGGGSSKVLANYGTGVGNNSRVQILCDSAANANKVTLNVRRDTTDTLAQLVSTSSVNSGPHMMLAYINWGTREGRLYIDGSLEAQNLALTAAAGVTGGITPTNPTIMASLAATAFLDGDIGEYFTSSTDAVSTTISDTEIDKIFGYAAHKWGLESLLPALHPYKTTAPTV